MKILSLTWISFPDVSVIPSPGWHPFCLSQLHLLMTGFSLPRNLRIFCCALMCPMVFIWTRAPLNAETAFYESSCKSWGQIIKSRRCYTSSKGRSNYNDSSSPSEYTGMLTQIHVLLCAWLLSVKLQRRAEDQCIYGKAMGTLWQAKIPIISFPPLMEWWRTERRILYLMQALVSETMITINLTTNVTYLVNCWVINFNNINVLSLSNSTKLVSEVIGERMY